MPRNSPITVPALDQLSPGVVLHGHYCLVRKLGAGAQGVTWLASTPDGGQVALKLASLRAAQTWKAIELWEREVQTLRQLGHPAIPKYLDAFRTEGPDGDLLFGLVQSFVDGQSLAELIGLGRKWSEAELVDIARQTLAVLAYLHGLQPPVIHRDLKPSNLLWTREGQLAVIDFGAVQVQMPLGPEGGSTVVGTHGYMPAEQLMGRAGPPSDLYALGATLIHLATGRPPSEFDVQRMKLHFEHVSQLSPGLETWLAHMVAAVPEDRPQSALAARAALDEAQKPSPLSNAKPVAPTRSSPATTGPSALDRMGKVFGAVFLCVVVFGVAWAAVKGKLRKQRGRDRAAPTTQLLGVPCKVQVELPPEMVGILITPLWCSRPAEGARFRSLTFNARLTNESPTALGNFHAQVQMLDENGAVLGGEAHLFVSNLQTVPLQPGESRVFGYSNWKPPAGVQGVRYIVRGPAKTFRPLATAPQEMPLEVLTALPTGGGLGVAQRTFQNRIGTGVDFTVRNTGSVPLQRIQIEVSFIGAGDQVLDRHVVTILESAVAALAAGDQTAVHASSTKQALRVRYALAGVAAATK